MPQTVTAKQGKKGLDNQIAVSEAELFVDELCDYANNHPAVNHPYLDALVMGNLPNTLAALQDFAYQYAFYSHHFTEYLMAIIGRLDSQSHINTLKHNLSEEQGQCGDGVSHRELFIRFQNGLGVNSDYKDKAKPCDAVLAWQFCFSELCQSESAAVGVGAIGIATEYIMPKIYEKILASVQQYSSLTKEEYIFLPLHCEADEEHGETLRAIAVDLAEHESNRGLLKHGVHEALQLREKFWDQMLTRAMSL